MSKKSFKFEYEEIDENYLEYDVNPSDTIEKKFSKKVKYYDEGKKSIEYGFKILKLNKENVMQIEKILMIDSSYAYADYSMDIKTLENDYTYENMRNLCIKINNANSTHINSDNKGSWVIPYRIIEKCSTFKKLKETLECGAEELITCIYLPINNVEFENVKNNIENILESNESKEEYKNMCNKYENKAEREKFNKVNHNISFASKFCNYVANKILDKAKRDYYPKYDNIVSKAIPLYINYYLKKNSDEKNSDEKNDYTTINKELETTLLEIIKEGKIIKKNREGQYTKIEFGKYDKDDSGAIYKEYQQYRAIIDAIRTYAQKRYKDSTEITRLGLDHILWYGYKGRLK